MHGITASKTLLLIAVGVGLASTPRGARGDLVLKDKDGKVVSSVSAGCGGDDFRGLEQAWSVTDKAGSVFNLQCENRTEFVGSVTVKATGRTTSFGRCVFTQGANIYKFETDANNNFTSIEWANVKPKGDTVAARAASRNKIMSDLATGTNETTDDWMKRVFKYYKDNGFEGDANNRFYMFPFSPNDQEIGDIENNTFVVNEVLTPSQADLAYLPDGNSPIPDLQIDPAMRIPGNDAQASEAFNISVPEPASLSLAACGFAAVFGTGLARRRAGRPRI